MEILYLLIPLSLLLVLLIGIVFWWASKSGQFDDLSGPGFRIIMDDDRPKPSKHLESEVEVNSKEVIKKEQA